jgi:hypothetical protein
MADGFAAAGFFHGFAGDFAHLQKTVDFVFKFFILMSPLIWGQLNSCTLTGSFSLRI